MSTRPTSSLGAPPLDARNARRRWRHAGIALLALAASACGGRVGDALDGPTAPLPAREEPAAVAAPQPVGAETIAAAVGEPTALATTGDRIVFTTAKTDVSGERVATGGLFVADKRVGPALMIALDRRGASYDTLATDGTTAFVGASDGRLLAVSLAGGEPTTLASLEHGLSVVRVVDEFVYFATSAGAVGRVPTKGGDVQVLGSVAGLVRGIEVTADALFVAAGASDSGEGAGITRIALGEGHEAKILGDGAEPCAMIRHGARLFWTAIEGGRARGSKSAVLRMSIDGGDVATVASGTFAACAIAVDDASLWFATSATGVATVKAAGSAGGLGLMRAPVGGGDPVLVEGARGALAGPGSVAVDATHVYWLTSSSVLRLRK